MPHGVELGPLLTARDGAMIPSCPHSQQECQEHSPDPIMPNSPISCFISYFTGTCVHTHIHMSGHPVYIFHSYSQAHSHEHIYVHSHSACIHLPLSMHMCSHSFVVMPSTHMHATAMLTHLNTILKILMHVCTLTNMHNNVNLGTHLHSHTIEHSSKLTHSHICIYTHQTCLC